jgi:hypothetical protein
LISDLWGSIVHVHKKNPRFSLLGSFVGDEEEKPVYLFRRLLLRLEIQNQSQSGGNLSMEWRWWRVFASH